MQNKVLATSEGLLRCLQALAEETASLGLTRTYFALQQAVSACRVESGLPYPPIPSAYVEMIH